MHHSHIDKFAYQDSMIHRLDCRVKLIIVLIFSAVVLSVPRTSLSILFCYAVGPFAILVLGNIPLLFVFKHILLISPFVLILALSCVLYDKTAVTVAFGPFMFETTLGWLRCLSIMGKFIVTMMALIALVSTTRFADLLAGLERLAVPRILITQLGFLYRYIFVLIDRAQHILRARAARTLRKLGFKKQTQFAAAMIGSLLVRSIDTAEHVNIAMQARGFDGHWRSISKLRISRRDYVFIFLTAFFIIALHFFVRPVL